MFLDASPAVCAARRVGRRARSEPENAEIEAYYHRFVWPAHVRHVCARAAPRPTACARAHVTRGCNPKCPKLQPYVSRRPVMVRLREAGHATLLDATATCEQARARGTCARRVRVRVARACGADPHRTATRACASAATCERMRAATVFVRRAPAAWANFCSGFKQVVAAALASLDAVGCARAGESAGLVALAD